MIYLNNTATSFPKPQVVVDAVNKYMLEPPKNSSRSGIDKEDGDYVWGCREKLSRLFNVEDPNHIVLTSGSTEALNQVFLGLDLEGGHVVGTEIEHNSVIRPMMTLKEDGKIEVDFAKCDSTGYVSPESIENCIKPNTKLVVVNHVSNVTGSELDLKAISAVAHKHNCIFAVDASQSVGLIDIDVQDMDIDYLAFTGHKNLFGLPGTGGLYMKEVFKLKPLMTGGTGVKSEVLTQPKEMTMYYESGTLNLPGICSLDAGVGFVLDTGIEKIRDHKVGMVKRIINELRDVPHVQIVTAETNNALCNFCFNIEGMVPEEINYILESSYDISVRSGLHCAPLLLKSVGVYPWGTVRASASYFTTDEEIDKFIFAIKDIVKIFKKA